MTQTAATQFKIGPYTFHRGATLAPMAGITNPPFRKLCTEHGALFCVTELVSCHAVVYTFEKDKNKSKRRGEKTFALMDKYADENPHIVQLYGRDPELMAQAAALVAQRGADLIDLNFGCPARKVIKNGMGSGVALMRDPALLEEITARVVQAVRIPVTAKTRIGYGPDEKNGVEIAKRMENGGAQLITIHGRTRDQGHSGPVDFDYLRNIVNAVSVPVIGNGGIKSLADGNEMLEKTGCTAVAVGQGAKGNPWLFKTLKSGVPMTDIPLSERLDVTRRHLELFIAWGGEDRAVIEMRKHACWYLKGFDGAAAFRKRLGEATSAKVFHDLLNNYF